MILMIDAGLFGTTVWLLSERNGQAKMKHLEGSVGEIISEIIDIIGDVSPTKIFFGEKLIDHVIRTEVTSNFNNYKYSLITILENGDVKYSS